MKLTGLFVAAALALCGGGLHAETCRDDRVQLRGDWGSAGFSVEVVDTVEDRARGLMFREQMARGAGMLFVYDTPGPVSFWMKNTLIPLDMVFVDDAGTVQRVHSNAIPGDLTPIDGGDDILVVLEINGGLAQRYGIGPGSQLRHPVFSDNGPVWPC
ncbi:MAG: hypothetical protein CML02_03220 [Pseudooceanicola sp.]|jgi:uncharacterized membrane protein (UPF0127 family)|nr:hypothetical protein [Pseudooceanicola sp.]|tara:strand:- start:3843 stop:4313 length:471 start_codon:yes stop_codon:yes gene_type:complete